MAPEHQGGEFGYRKGRSGRLVSESAGEYSDGPCQPRRQRSACNTTATGNGGEDGSGGSRAVSSRGSDHRSGQAKSRIRRKLHHAAQRLLTPILRVNAAFRNHGGKGSGVQGSSHSTFANRQAACAQHDGSGFDSHSTGPANSPPARLAAANAGSLGAVQNGGQGRSPSLVFAPGVSQALSCHPRAIKGPAQGTVALELRAAP